MKVKTSELISESISGRENIFDFLRFIAAFLVIFSHAFPISVGSNEQEPFSILTGGDATLGKVAVSVFFVISGFLITMSYDRSKSALQFLKSRVLRIFPGLAFVLIVTSLVIGALATSLPLSEYYANSETYKYFANIALKTISNVLPGAFEGNVYGRSVNGALWTLQYEFACYLLVLFLGLTRMLNKFVVVLGFVLSFAIYFVNLPEQIESGVELFSFFSAGMLLYLFRKAVPLRSDFALLSLIALAVSIYLGVFVPAFAMFGSYLIIYLSYRRNKYLTNFAKYGDFSYGIYIFGFPIQQLITQYSGGTMNPAMNFVTAAPIVLMLAMLSWHLVEKRALKYKTFTFNKAYRPSITINSEVQ